MSKYMNTKPKIKKLDFYPNYDSDEKIEMIAE